VQKEILFICLRGNKPSFQNGIYLATPGVKIKSLRVILVNIEEMMIAVEANSLLFIVVLKANFRFLKQTVR